MNKQNIIAENNYSTVVAEYTPLPKTQTSYQSEAELEQDFIARLERLGYARIYNPKEQVLINNLRRKLEKLNSVALCAKGFSDREWEQVFREILANRADSVQKKTERLQVENRYTITRDNGTEINIMLIDKDNIFNNDLQVFNQYVEGSTPYKGIYDVTVLVNGLPLVHIELKRRGVAIKEAFNQIARYSKDNFFGSSGLFEWVQLFVISNGTETKYYSNTTREQSIAQSASFTSKRKTSHSFEFTSYWADARNRNILDLADFTETFFSKGTLLNILTKYCVFTVDKLLLVMRPYQIVATEKIIERIKYAEHYKKVGTIEAGGYIWHTTGSGKTLTSFKTAQIATYLEFIDKVIFVVDRKDLDYQTIKEFEKFGGKDSVSGNVSTNILKNNLDSDDQKIIVTTIQKLNKFVSKYTNQAIYNKRCVIIFDECHRSQFGKMHLAITKAFKNYYLFGFTGTPIFLENASSGSNIVKTNRGVENIKTTEQIFGKCLHSYTIVDAISDGNVLPFRVDLVDTIKFKDGVQDVKVHAIDKDSALKSPERISVISKYILDYFDTKTYRQDGIFYEHKVLENIVELAKARDSRVDEIRDKRRVKGFNALFAVDSIASAKLFYTELKRQIAERYSDLRIATIFCYTPNEDIEAFLDEEFETELLDTPSRDFLESAIADYNAMFGTSWDTQGDNFGAFYKDVSMRVKNKEIDLLIVVNMFLTGFDATTLNTLWVDKNLRYHGLIQSFSRTNRILNAQKRFGNIVTFRNLESQINEACSLFGDRENTKNIVVIRPFADYYNGYDNKPGYVQIVAELQSKFDPNEFFASEAEEREFINLFGTFLRVENIMRPFDEFIGKEILSQRERQDYQSVYLTLNEKYRKQKEADAVSIVDDLVFEIELIKQLTVNIDYILLMVERYASAKDKKEQELVLGEITSTINSRPELRSKKELILGFISTVNNNSLVSSQWRSYVTEKSEQELTDLIADEELNDKKARRYVENCLQDGEIKEIGTELDEILPPMSMFEEPEKRMHKKRSVIEKIKLFLEQFFGV